ncbi:hypothetical protein MT418_006976 [Batrachochytrium dendrobatidis]
MKLAQWNIVLGASSMALAAVSSGNSGHEFHLQRRALELSEQDMHLFARSPIPVIPTVQGMSDGGTLSGIQQKLIDTVPGNSGQSGGSGQAPGSSGQANPVNPTPKVDSGFNSPISAGDKVRGTLDRANQRGIHVENQPSGPSQQSGSSSQQPGGSSSRRRVISPEMQAKIAKIEQQMQGNNGLGNTMSRAGQNSPEPPQRPGGLDQQPGGSGQVPQKKGLWGRVKDGATGAFKRKGGPNQQPGGPNQQPGGPNQQPGGPNQQPGGSDQVPQKKGLWGRMKDGATGVFKKKMIQINSLYRVWQRVKRKLPKLSSCNKRKLSKISSWHKSKLPKLSSCNKSKLPKISVCNKSKLSRISVCNKSKLPKLYACNKSKCNLQLLGK